MLGYNFSSAVTKKMFEPTKKVINFMMHTWGPQTRILLMLLIGQSTLPRVCFFVVVVFFFHFLIKISELKSIYTVGRASEWSLKPRANGRNNVGC